MQTWLRSIAAIFLSGKRVVIRIVFAGLAGGAAMFAWTSIAHVATPLGETGVKELRNEEVVLGTMKAAIGEENGFYIFPSRGLLQDRNIEQIRAPGEQHDAGSSTQPSGILVYSLPGRRAFTPMHLVVEFVSHALQSVALAFVLAYSALGGFISRLCLTGAVGAAAVTSTSVSYFNWYGFPLDYTLAYMATDFIGFVVAGIVILALLNRAQPR
jgi:hypothetical protein